MISFEEYFGPWLGHEDATEERRANAVKLLTAVGLLERLAITDGVEFPDNPATGSGVSGQTYGGFRPQDCPQGAAHSSHKEALAVDRYDPHGDIDKWCVLNSEVGGKLEQCGIYIEHPADTPGWSHWTLRRPGSGNRVFHP
jgi:hypothetical protein